LLRVLGNRVMVKVDEAETTRGGIVLPDSAQQKSQKATVVAVGEGRRSKEGKLIPIDLQVGDRIVFAKYGGTEIRHDGQDYLILNVSDIYAKQA